MSKKDYIKFAAMLKETKLQIVQNYGGAELLAAHDVINNLQKKIEVIFGNDNYNFDYTRFEQAASIEED